jgi:hypothetical protein
MTNGKIYEIAELDYYSVALIHRVSILKFFLPSPSGPAKNKKTFKKWTQCLLGGVTF